MAARTNKHTALRDCLALFDGNRPGLSRETYDVFQQAFYGARLTLKKPSPEEVKRLRMRLLVMAEALK